MSKIDLNIVDRGVQGTNWIAEDVGLTAEHLDDVMEQKTDNSGALNSLPTPFARFFVAKEAFRRAKEEHLNSKKEAGFAYRQLVSDILDVYELLFNIKYHRNNSWRNGEKLEIRELIASENLDYLKAKMPVLYNSVVDYYSSDIDEKKLYFLVFAEDGRDKLLACSSPYTGFVTPADIDKALVREDGSKNIIFSDQTADHDSKYRHLHIHRKSGGEYFRDIKLFEDREADFKNYMYYTLFGSDNIESRYKAIKEYIRSFKNDPEIRNDYSIRLTPVLTDQNDALVVNGLSVMSSDEIDINGYFTPTLIKIPYRISRQNYVSVNYQNDNEGRDYDFLLPFKPEVLALFEDNEIDTDLHINRNSVTVNLRYNGKTYQKEYAKEPFRSGQGRIVDLKDARINFDLGLFPNILSFNDAENNYFKIMVVANDETKNAQNFNIHKINLTFFKNKVRIRVVNTEDTALYGVRPSIVRSRNQSSEEDGGTKFYELFGTSFDAIEVQIFQDSGLLIPKWLRSKSSGDSYTYAIDFGTTNTFIARSKNDANNLPELFYMDKPMVNYLHEVQYDSQYNQTNLIENSIFSKAKKKIQTEFLPALIDKNVYNFPIRTALCYVRNYLGKPKLFDSHNIAFFYEKMMPNDDQEIETDIKWNGKEELPRLFIRELLLIIKCDILQRNGDLSLTNLVWFRPLSFAGTTKSLYDDIWQGTLDSLKGEPTNLLFIQNSQIQCYTESEAPYYYFKKKAIIPDSDAVTVIDIGGGSTDFVYFKDNIPLISNSVHFGCDVLWDNGFVDFDNAKENGIYKHYAATLKFDRDDLKDLNESMKCNVHSKTRDIIDFWLSNAKHCDIIKRLRDEYKSVFVYHFTSIIYYMSIMYKDNKLNSPKTIVFSGNGSKYIDSFISTDRDVLRKIINLVFDSVFEGVHDVNLVLPRERKEATCYGGLYRNPTEKAVPEIVYQGDNTYNYENVGKIIEYYDELKSSLLVKYNEFSTVYKNVLNLLKKERVIDSSTNTNIYCKVAEKDMGKPLDTYFKTQVKEKYPNEVIFNDSVFFLPIIDRIFEMTNL